MDRKPGPPLVAAFGCHQERSVAFLYMSSSQGAGGEPRLQARKLAVSGVRDCAAPKTVTLVPAMAATYPRPGRAGLRAAPRRLAGIERENSARLAMRPITVRTQRSAPINRLYVAAASRAPVMSRYRLLAESANSG